MKKIVLLFTFFLSISILYPQDYTNWKWQHQTPQGNTLRWVKMWDANTWYAVGLEGTFMKTTDGGQTWYFHHKAGVPLTDESPNSLYTAHFFDQNTGIVAGGDGVMRTTDGGITFSPLSVPMSTTGTIYGSHFYSSTGGFVSGSSSIQIQHTTDAGLTWTQLSGVGTTTSYDVFSPDGNLVIVASTSGNTRRSTDGGATFTTINVGTSFTIYKLAFKDSKNGWAVGSTGKAFFTEDGGLTWTNKSAGLPSTTLYDVDFRMVGTTEQVVVTGDAFNLYATTDLGTTWTQIDFLGAGQRWTSTYYSTDFLNDKLVAVGGTGLINSKEGASAAVAHTNHIKAGTLYDIWAEGPDGKVIAVGAKGNTTTFDQVMYSTNGGQTWATVNWNSTSTYRTIDMLNANAGYIAGLDGSVYKTIDGGVNWDSLTTPLPTMDFYGMDFVTETSGFVCGQSGSLIKTTNSGKDWETQTSGVTTTIYSVDMVDENTGWYCGASGKVAKTTDGGATWVSQTSGMGTSTCYKVEAITGKIAYVAGASGKVAKTIDGGETWTLLTLPSGWGTSYIYDMSFRDENYGVVAGSVSKTATTTDGGATWTLEFASTSSTLYGVTIAMTGSDTTAAYVCGVSGSVVVNNLFVVPVELSSFTANVNGNSVRLNWITDTEKNNSGFAVERKTENNSFEQIDFIEGNGTSTEKNSYSFNDKNLSSGKYVYRLKQMDYDGTFEYSKEIEVEVSVPVVFSLEQNYPNPFNPATVINYSILSNEFVNLVVYNSIGEKVTTLVNNLQEAGNYQISFDASRLAAGVYIYKLQAGDFVSVKKMTLIK
jgi:photosystem II stability/assembly factor-like uncharacterized protein